MTSGIHVQFSGATLGDVRTQAAAFLSELDGEPAASTTGIANNPAPAKRGRRSNAEIAAATVAAPATAAPLANGHANIFDDEPETVAAAPTKAYTKEDVNAAVQSVLNKKGGETAKALLTKFGAASTGKLKESDYSQFIAECTKASA